MKPFFSIVIPTFNSASTISQTIDSVVVQDFKDYEIIVIDDCSNDNTIDIINNYKNKYNNIYLIIKDSNSGVAESRNIGFSVAKGKYIALLDSDDLWTKDKLKMQYDTIRQTGCDICCSAYDFIDEDGNSLNKVYNIKKEITYNDLLKENYIGCSTVAIRATLLNKNSMNNEFAHEDYALWLKLLRKGVSVVGINTVLTHYRIMQGSRSHNKLKAAINRFKIYTKQERMNIFIAFKWFVFYIINAIKKYHT